MRRTEWTTLLGELEYIFNGGAIANFVTRSRDLSINCNSANNAVLVQGCDLGLVGHVCWVAGDLGGFGASLGGGKFRRELGTVGVEVYCLTVVATRADAMASMGVERMVTVDELVL